MIAFDARSYATPGRDACRTWRAHLDAAASPHAYDALTTALIETGMLESACADAVCPDAERRTPLLTVLRQVSEALGTALAALHIDAGEQAAAALADARAAASTIDDDAVPAALRISVPEGYAYYALYPEMYAHAIAEWADGAAPTSAVCVGVRSIGTSLSAIVTGALRLRGVAVRSWTVRPRGHPFDRRVTLASDVIAHLDPRDAIVLIVDEGPGLSGSSFAGTAAAFSDLGVTDDQIAFVPSWAGDPDRLISSSARARWRRHRTIVPAFDRIRVRLAEAGIVPPDAVDVSAGTWREHFALREPWPATQPQHERRKYVGADRAWIARFAGLGSFGTLTCRRAAALADAGWTSAPGDLRLGFLQQTLVDGTPLTHDAITPEFLEHAASYVAWLRGHASTGDAVDPSPLADMLQTNTREAFGDTFAAVVDRLSGDARTFAEPATAIDGRLMPHEWIARDSSWVKVDALDHHRDHFLPGCTDAAWDVAGAIVELALDDASRRAFVERYISRSGDAAIGRRLPFYLAAYAAFRMGYCRLAADALHGFPDGKHFEALERRYAARLGATLAPSAG